MLIPRTVADLMTREVVTVHEEDNLAAAEEAMGRHGFRHVPVVDGERVVGLISNRDVLRYSVSPLEGRAVEADADLKSVTFVADIMSREVTTVNPETPLEQAADLMLAGKLGCLPVIDWGGRLVGIVTSTDFVRLVARLLDSR